MRMGFTKRKSIQTTIMFFRINKCVLEENMNRIREYETPELKVTRFDVKGVTMVLFPGEETSEDVQIETLSIPDYETKGDL